MGQNHSPSAPLSPSPAEDELRTGSETSLRASAGATVTSLIKHTQVLLISNVEVRVCLTYPSAFEYSCINTFYSLHGVLELKLFAHLRYK